MKSTRGSTTTTVPVSDHAALTLSTLTSIIRQSGVARRLFER